MYIQRLVIVLVLLIVTVGNEKAIALQEALAIFGKRITSHVKSSPFGLLRQSFLELGIDSTSISSSKPPISINECVRDNMQNVISPKGDPVVFPIEQKTRFINAVGKYAVPGTPFKIDAVSFAHPRLVPQMAGSSEVLQALPYGPYVTYSCIVPNQKGLNLLTEALAKRGDALKPEVGVIVSANEEFSQANLGTSVESGVRTALSLIEEARKLALPTRAYISMALGTPNGTLAPEIVENIARRFDEAKCNEIVLCDTAGVAYPRGVFNAFRGLSEHIRFSTLAAHLHVTEAETEKGLVNALAAYHAGITSFDSGSLTLDPKIGFVQGCKFSPGAPRNIQTPYLVWLFESLELRTNMDFERMLALNERILEPR